MSLIADALRKTGSSPSSLTPVRPPSPKPPWIYGFLLIVCAGVGIAFLGRTPKPAPQTASRPASMNPNKAAPALSSSPMGLNILRTAESQWRLNGTVRGGGGRALALINNQVVEEGGSIQGVKVVRVGQNQVDLESNGQAKTLKLK